MTWRASGSVSHPRKNRPSSRRIFPIIVSIYMCLLGFILWRMSYVTIRPPMESSSHMPDSRLIVPLPHIITRDMPIYTDELAKIAIRPGPWRCVGRNDDDADDARRPSGAATTNDGTIFAFVHVYKTAGSTMRTFFHELAYACRRTWVSLAKCTGLLPSSIESRDGRWRPCMIEEVADGRGRRKAQYVRVGGRDYRRFHFGKISNPTFESKVDIFGGHVRLGTGDRIYRNSTRSGGRGGVVRYIVFLRDPVERYVSGVLYQNKVSGRNEGLEEVVKKIKDRIANARRDDKYWDKSLSYLLTPAQRVATTKSNSTPSSTAGRPPSGAEARAMLAIRNLHEYNVIVGMTERMAESLAILRHVFLSSGMEIPLKDDGAEAVFKKYGLLVAPLTEDGIGNRTLPSVSAVGVHANKSSRKTLSTSAVVAELAKDEGHVLLMDEYVKYERMITDFAWTMHNLQYECVMRVGRTIDS
ncbi:hypothetical protein ACHAXA_009418 [Cyclostephanos tholiformis]|uniref:Uncharacterized protein n=1 Tax=Cyclostephanos tholiformis TaxID=382380 RepID=A0ABD3R989_9STRA